MSSQLSDLAFFHFLCVFHNTLNKRVENCHIPGDLDNQVDCTAYVWSHNEDGPNCLCLIIPEFFLDQVAVPILLKPFEVQT